MINKQLTLVHYGYSIIKSIIFFFYSLKKQTEFCVDDDKD